MEAELYQVAISIRDSEPLCLLSVLFVRGLRHAFSCVVSCEAFDLQES